MKVTNNKWKNFKTQRNKCRSLKKNRHKRFSKFRSLKRIDTRDILSKYKLGASNKDFSDGVGPFITN